MISQPTRKPAAKVKAKPVPLHLQAALALRVREARTLRPPVRQVRAAQALLVQRRLPVRARLGRALREQGQAQRVQVETLSLGPRRLQLVAAGPRVLAAQQGQTRQAQAQLARAQQGPAQQVQAQQVQRVTLPPRPTLRAQSSLATLTATRRNGHLCSCTAPTDRVTT